jgi:hypothetical protein
LQPMSSATTTTARIGHEIGDRPDHGSRRCLPTELDQVRLKRRQAIDGLINEYRSAA